MCPRARLSILPLTWLVREADAGLTLQLLDGADIVVRVPVLVGDAAQAAALPAPSPAATSQAVESKTPATPGLTGAPASPSPARSATPPPTARPVMAAIGTLLIHSGRPDPDWAFTDEDLEELAAIAAGLAPIEGSVPEGGLGYRGFRVTGPKGTWRANAGVVSDSRLGARHVPRGPRTSRRAIPLGDRPRVAQRGRSRGRRRRALEVTSMTLRPRAWPTACSRKARTTSSRR